MDDYDFKKIEKKWQKRWDDKKIFEVKEDKKKKKYYVLEMYPYPSASYLHMGHIRNFTIGDVYARFKRMNGFNVLYPMGYDSFGLPAETASKKEGIHPRVYTEQAIKKISEYFRALGNSYDWSKTLASHEPDYYKWNQYFFIKLFEKGLAYRKKALVNWCENCQSVLANEESEGGKCWRCSNEVIQKETEQWFFKITDYADRLLDDLSKIEWPERIKVMQKNWIGRSEGAEVLFEINGEKWPVFTTRADTIFGVTFVAVSSQHSKLMKLVTEKQKKEVEKFIKKLKSTKEDELNKIEKEGVFTGSYAINPVTKNKVPVYAANFVVADYGSGMVMGVPAHDKRDFDFAVEYGIPNKVVIEPKDFEIYERNGQLASAYEGEGELINSGEFNGMENKKALNEIIKYLEKKNLGKKKVQFKIRDWMISRQRYWGTPIPIIYCDKCGMVPVPEKDLPVLLPEKVDFKTNGNPLSTSKSFVDVKCPKCGGKGKRETDTMGGFVDSSWYFLRYCDNKNKKKPFDESKVDYWMPVDQYIGGAEHAVMHLMYARFFVKALKDLGFLKFDEPFKKLFNQGILYKDGAKMSKSKGNVVFQTDISDKYGIDTARLFLMFVSSPDKQMEWNDEGVEGSFRIINKLIRLNGNLQKKSDERQESKINSLIKKVTESIDDFEYPKAVVSMIEFLDYAAANGISKDNYSILLRLFHLFCPHITEELWEKTNSKGFISLSNWPVADENKINENLEKDEKNMEKLAEDINSIQNLFSKEKKKAQTVYIYVIPNEKKLLEDNIEMLEKKTKLKVKVYLVNDKNKYDPQEKSKRAKPGKPALYLE
jgi:leucyl-tRNA synthetase